MTLASMIIMLLVIVLLIIIFKKISDTSEEEAYNSRCHASLMAYARAKNMPFGDAAADESSIKCPTKYLTIEDDKPSNMRKDISNLMAECWKNFGEGNIRLFNAQDEKFCTICSVFQFEDKSEKLTGLPTYMMTTRSPYIRDKKRVTYDEFISGKQTSDIVIDALKTAGVDNNYLDGSKRYAVMFTYYKQSYWSKMKSAAYGAAVGVAAGAVMVVGIAAGAVIAGATWGVGTPISILIVTGSAAAGAAIAASGSHSSAGVTTEGADWDANIILAEYSAQGLADIGCTALPVSQMDERFR